ncbi:MAG: cyclic nucleotide-binding domain-containing protein [Chloroflexi bacterium]|nr:cyclic nucleotide-binding domain-containing protein [Chloroflexota bacterium]
MIAPAVLRHFPFFSFLSPAQLRAVADLAKEETLDAGVTIFNEGQHADYLYILVKGSVDLFFTAEVKYRPELTKELHFGVIEPGKLFGISALVEPYVLTSSARTSRPSQVIKIEAAGLINLCQSEEKLAYGLIRQVAASSMERLNATRLQLAAAWSTVYT